jgi:hypothetical protein
MAFEKKGTGQYAGKKVPGKKVPDSMPWILWNSPVEVRPRERAGLTALRISNFGLRI